MSRRVYEYRGIDCRRYAGPGGAERYQITGPSGFVQLTYDELVAIVSAIDDDRAATKRTDGED